MKKLIIALAALMVSVAAYGQGQFVFNNRIPPDINAKFSLSDGTIPAGDAYTVQILAGATADALAPVASTTFRTGAAAGYVNPLTVTVPNLVGPTVVRLQMFAGNTTTGTAYPLNQDFNVTTTVAPATPPNLALGTAELQFIVPEPTTWALALLGLGGLLAIRRRK
jgi:hypothetical protein